MRRKGQYSRALATFRRAHELSRGQPDWSTLAEQGLHDCERALALEPKFATLTKGGAQPTDNFERRTLAQMCHDKALYAVGNTILGPGLPSRSQVGRRLEDRRPISCCLAAALAGSGQGNDEPLPGEADLAHLRSQAREWVAADLVQWTKQLATSAARGAP